jgi:CheY-like chemotaxis protein
MSPWLQPEEKLTFGKESRQILVVDDEPTVCETIKMVLEHEGHKVQTANSGKEALVLLEQV